MTDQITKLIIGLRSVAPKLCPDFWNKSINETIEASEEPVPLKHISKLEKTCKSCSLCSQSIESGCSVVVDYELSADAKSVSAKRLLPICSDCLLVKDLSSLYQLIASISANPSNKKLETQLSSIATHFLKVNGHDLANAQAFHSTLTTAYTLSQLCRPLPLLPSILVSLFCVCRESWRTASPGRATASSTGAGPSSWASGRLWRI